MIRDVLSAIQAAYLAQQPPTVGLPVVVPGPSNTGPGVVACDASTRIYGTYNVFLQVVTGGPVGTATAQLSLDDGNNVANPNSHGNLGAPFVLPAAKPGYQVPLPALSPGLASPAPSGLVLNFSGNFNAGDVYVLQALPTPTFLFGKPEVSSQDSLFPRVLLVPTDDDFTGPEDFAGQVPGQPATDQRTQQRALLTDVAHFEVHCWGIDYDRTEVLRDSAINAVWYGLQAAAQIRRGKWEHDAPVSNAGFLYVFQFSVKKPVMKLSVDTIVAQPPFTADITQAFEDQP